MSEQIVDIENGDVVDPLNLLCPEYRVELDPGALNHLDTFESSSTDIVVTDTNKISCIVQKKASARITLTFSSGAEPVFIDITFINVEDIYGRLNCYINGSNSSVTTTLVYTGLPGSVCTLKGDNTTPSGGTYLVNSNPNNVSVDAQTGAITLGTITSDLQGNGTVPLSFFYQPPQKCSAKYICAVVIKKQLYADTPVKITTSSKVEVTSLTALDPVQTYLLTTTMNAFINVPVTYTSSNSSIVLMTQTPPASTTPNPPVISTAA